MLLLMVPLCVWLGRRDPALLLAAFFLCWLVMHACIGANTPGYYKLIAKTIPAERRGRLYGFGGALSGLLGAGAALLAGRFLGDWGFPDGYAACFLASFVVMAVTVLPLGFMREAAQPPEAVPERIGVRRALALVVEDRRLLWLGVVVALFSLNGMASAFYTLYAIQRFQAGAEAVAQFTAVLMATRTVAYLLVGWLGDAKGNRAALQVSTFAGIAAALTALLAPDLGWMYAVFAWNEVATLGWGVCAINYVLELCPPERSGTYTAVYGVVSGPFRVVLPLFGGAFAAAVGFAPLFAAAAVGGLLALALLTARLPEPRSG
jgi:MFS family permease